MSCGELFVNLGGGSTPPNGMLQTTAALSSSLQVVKDNLGNGSALKISTTQIEINSSLNRLFILNGSTAPYISFGADVHFIQGFLGSPTAGITIGVNGGTKNLFIKDTDGLAFGGGTITQNGALTIKGAGGNIVSFRDSSNVEQAGVLSNGVLFSGGLSIGQTNVNLKGIVESGSQIQANYVNNGGFQFSNSSTGFKTFIIGRYSEDMVSIGGITNAFPALKRSAAILQTKLADDSAFAVHEVLSILTQKPTNSNAQKIKFGDKSPITDGALVALGFDAQWEVEINGSSYWFAGKTSAFA